MQRLTLLLRRTGVFATWGSVARVGAWAIIAGLVLGRIIPSTAATYDDRPHPADVPPSAVRYVGPIEKGDEDGFLAPAHDPGSFTLAWIGGSDVKLKEVSLPAELASRVSAVGGRPLAIDAYTALAMRPLDALIALQAAIDNDADAIVMSINPVWFFPEWSEQAWQALDVAYPGALWRQRATWGWAPFLDSPGDLLLAMAATAMPLVDNRGDAHDSIDEWFRATDILVHPTTSTGPATTLPGLPADSSDFWMLHERGRASQTSFSTRFTALLQGLEGVDHSAGDSAIEHLLQLAADAGRPVYFYLTPVSFEVLDDPVAEPLVAALEARLARLAEGLGAAHVVVQAESLSRLMEPGPLFRDVVHLSDPVPLLDLLTPRLCALWESVGAACTTGAAP